MLDTRFVALKPCMSSLSMNPPPGWVRRYSPFEIVLLCPAGGVVEVVLKDKRNLVSQAQAHELPAQILAEYLFANDQKLQYAQLLQMSPKALSYILETNELYQDFNPMVAEAVAIAQSIRALKVCEDAISEIENAL